MEDWKIIDDTNGNYEVNSLGVVRSKLSGKWRVLKNRIHENGYLVADIITTHGKKTKKIHRLIAIYFIPNPNNYKIVNHISGEKLNNSINNLEWCTSSHNNQEAWNNGLYKKKYGADNKLACLTWDQAADIRSMRKNGFHIKEIMDKYKVSESTVCKIISNKKYISL